MRTLSRLQVAGGRLQEAGTVQQPGAATSNLQPATFVAQISGYASIFDVADMNGDIVAPGAFRAALAKRADVKMLYQHAVEAPIGRWTRLAEDRKGLFVEGELLLSSSRGREAYALLAGGAIDGLSIGFKTVRARKDGALRVILEADLWEVSIVTFPMAAHARITRLSPPHENSPIADARGFAGALRSAAAIFAVETKVRAPSLAKGGLSAPASSFTKPALAEREGSMRVQQREPSLSLPFQGRGRTPRAAAQQS